MSRIRKVASNKRIWALIVTLTLLLPLIRVSSTYAVNTSSKETIDTAMKKVTAKASSEDIKYIDVDYFNYKESDINKYINSSNTKASLESKIYFRGADSADMEIQNRWGSNANGVVQGLVENTLKNGNLKFASKYNMDGVQLFPTDYKDQQEAYRLNGIIEGYNGYKFPLKKSDNGYYEFNSSSSKYNGSFRYSGQTVYKDQLLEGSTNTLKLLDSSANAGSGGFWLLNKMGQSQRNEDVQFTGKNKGNTWYYGAKFATQFKLPEGQKIVKENGQEEDIIFDFVGDDDVWVYLGSNESEDQSMKLSMDLGGIHGPMHGTINFTTGLITYDNVRYDGVNNINNGKRYWYLYSKNEYNKQSQQFRGTYKISKFVGLDRRDDSEYSFKMFYLERGGHKSTCSMRMNFQIMPSKTISIKKEVGGYYNPAKLYTFQLLDKNGKKLGEDLNLPANVEGTFKDANGVDIYVETGTKYSVREVFASKQKADNWKTTLIKVNGKNTEIGLPSNDKYKVTNQLTAIRGQNQLVFKNEYCGKLYPVSVEKVIRGLTNDQLNKSFTFKLLNSYGKQIGKTLTLDASNSYKGTFDVKLPPDTTCFVQEIFKNQTEASKWITSWGKVGSTNPLKVTMLTINPNSNNKVVCTNTSKAKQVTVSKTVENIWSMLPGQKYTFELYIDGNKEPVETLTLENGQTGIFKWLIWPGEQYYIKETSSHSSDYSVSYTAGNDVVTSMDGKTRKLSIDTTTNVKFTNTYNLGSITVEKRLVASKESDNLKKDNTDQSFIFVLNGTTNQGKQITLTKQVTMPKGDAKKSVTFENVPLGIYTVKELSNEVYTEKETIISDENKTNDGKIVLTGTNKDATVTISNYRTDTGHFVDHDLAENIGRFVEKYTFIKEEK
ncbi:MAG: DUF5979 domain-containing protein [bacterium]|nr:DUF5979 domain-containing protein [bacterium]